MEGSVPPAIGLTLFAGLSTGLGSFVVLFSKKPSVRLLSFGLGFASGVMVYVSLVELLPEAANSIGAAMGEAAVVQSFLSGLAEPAGGLAVYLVLLPFVSDAVIGGMLAAVAGIMVFISFDELLPAAREYDQGHTGIAGVVAGMAVMAVSLLLLH